MWWIGALAGMFGLLVTVFSGLMFSDLSFGRNYVRNLWFWFPLGITMELIILVNWGLGDLPTLVSRMGLVILNSLIGTVFGTLIIYIPEVVRLRREIAALKQALAASTAATLHFILSRYPGSPDARLQAFDDMVRNGIIGVDAAEVDRLRDLLK